MKIHRPEISVEDVETALQLLKEGNERYVKGELTCKASYKADREILRNGQKPFAVVIACSDSRVVPEIFFDQKPGSIFIIRNAGNIADATVLGSIEYAVEHLGSKLVVVCGHSKCGAVEAACSGRELTPNLKFIVERIKPAIDCDGNVDKSIINNVKLMVEQIKADEIVQKPGVTVIGAYYDVHIGTVKWL